MSQLVIPCGFELVEFTWDCLPDFRAPQKAVNPLSAFVNEHLTALGVFCAPRTAVSLDRTPIEEEPERWDGLS